ncbi:MAG: SusC/RagA family TonB-linked outer membrane protein [Bacteroidetes bacterium]|nr:MAG: SusC/RagA family TonB-linked outer membrane protein [Bacteroidota bacterium]
MKRLFFLSVLLFLFCWGYGQTTITGLVRGSDGSPLVGASVVEQGTSNGTLTDSQGKFSLQVKGPDSKLLIRYVGMKEQVVDVGNNASINVILEQDVTILDEVVITSLGFKESKDRMGATSTVIDPMAVTRSGETGLINALSAKASNVRINRSNGDPGAGSAIRIRGANTISGSSEPLIIVDGVPLNNSTTYGGGNNITGGRTGGTSQQSRLNDINPNDIESVQVLKGASAAALWGSRAANGVIVITTKEGSIGKPKISYKASLSFDEVSERIPMQTTWGQGRDGSYSPTRAEAWGDYIPDRSGGPDEVNTSGQFFTAEDGTVYYPITQKNSKETFVDKNWDQVFQTGGFWQHDFSISGGSDRASYFFSLGRLDQNGIIKNSFYDRTNVRFNNKLFLTDWLTLSTKSAYTLTKSNRIQQSSNTAGLMLGLLRTPPDFDIEDYKGDYTNSSGQVFKGRHRSYRRYLGNAVNPIYNNPRWTVEEQRATTDVNRFVVTPQLNITPTKWLQVILRGNADISDDKRVYFFPIGSGGDRSVGIFAEDIIGRRELNFDAIAKGNFTLSSAIDMTATLGWSINDRSYRRNSGRITGFLVNATKETTSLNTAAENSVFDNFKTFRRSNRGYGIVSLDFFDQVFLNLSGGLEASSTISKSFFYPAADVAWVFSKDLQQSEVFSFGKLRAAWGKVGVQPRAHAFETLAEGGFTYSTYSDPLDVSLFGGGFRIDNNQGNPELEPEIKTEWEIGTDLRFFNNKLGLSLTYYNNKIDGILLDVELAPSSGFATKYGNFGAMKNNGIELDLNWKILEKKDIHLDMNLNFARNRNTVTDLFGTETIDLTPGASVSSRAIVGYPLGVLYGTGSQKDANGNFILDENGFPQLTSSPEVLGDPNPDWRGGIAFNFSWKNLGVNLVVEHSQGGEFSPRSLWVLRRFGTTQETANRITLSQDLKNFDGDVIAAGTTVRGNIEDFGGGPVLLDETWYRHGIGGGFGDNQAYNFSIFDATFTKVREFTISYNINGEGFQRLTSLGSIVIAATTRNFFAWDKIEGIDPETNQTGVGNGYGLEYFTNPQTRSFLFTLGVNF